MAAEPRASRGAWFRRNDETGKRARLTLDKVLEPHERAALGSWHWECWARDAQMPPDGAWRVWLIFAGRGFGKTRAGAEWVRNLARHDSAARIALVGASLGEVRGVMVEGESGLLAAAPGALAPEYEPSLRRLQWPNGAQAFLYSAAEPESLRGPQHSHACWTGSARILRQREPRSPRPSRSRRDRGSRHRAARAAPGRRVLAGWRGSHRCVGGAR
jgi:hypothetical protein